MSNLLEFQQEIKEGKAVIYSIRSQDLNPTDLNLKEVQETEKRFNKDDYNLVSLREYILQHSAKLTEAGDVIAGKLDPNTGEVVLTVLEIQDEDSN